MAQASQEYKELEFIRPDWPAPANVHAATTTRLGGVSRGAYHGFNLATHVDDELSRVAANRQLLKAALDLPAEPVWLDQVHSARVVSIDESNSADFDTHADAAWSTQPGKVCAVLTADCLPLLICDLAGTRVASVHAGWRGLHAGVISATLSALDLPGEQLLAWLGPAIGSRRFEVGADVYHAFVARHPGYVRAFQQIDDQHWLCDIYRLARIELEAGGVSQVFGGNDCTFSDSERFYSFRRDGITGRMASLIWLE